MCASIVDKIKHQDTTRTAEEKVFASKYESIANSYINDYFTIKKQEYDRLLNKYLGNGDGYFKDFINLQSICRPLSSQTVVPISEVEKMRIPFYTEYVKAKNAEIVAKIAAEKARGGYHLHQVGESEGDALLVDMIKDFKGKVILIDFWNTWCMPCRHAIKQMEPMKEEFEGKDVVFMYIADESSAQKEYDGMIVSMKGEHYRLSESQQSSLMRKWGFTGIPSYVIIGKDGMVKDYHTGFQHAEYYKQKINEELNK